MWQLSDSVVMRTRGARRVCTALRQILKYMSYVNVEVDIFFVCGIFSLLCTFSILVFCGVVLCDRPPCREQTGWFRLNDSSQLEVSVSTAS